MLATPKVGTGKSTLVKYIIEALGVSTNKVCYATFTGKAAEVLRKKGCPNACTLHKLLYEYRLNSNGTFTRYPRPALEYSIVVVDEISMAPKEMMDLLFKHRCYVLGLGDPFQLPPISASDNNGLLDHPHIFLDEIMRQAADNEIIRISLDIRQHKPLSLFDGQNVKILNHTDLTDGMLLWADEIICAKNVTRNMINNKVRQLIGKTGEVEDGDKVICLRNYWDIVNDNGDALVNGTITYLHSPLEKLIQLPRAIYTLETKEYQGVITKVQDFDVMILDKKFLLEGVPALSVKDQYKVARSQSGSELVPREFAFGYAITCHKAQGSSWGNVLVIEENFPFDKVEHQRWLYTALTRAEDKCVIIKQ